MVNSINGLTPKKDAKHSDRKEPVYPPYVVITPAFNEEKNIGTTIDSMISQIQKPKVWIIIDDGSSDKTWDVISLAAGSHSWIKACRRDVDQNRRNDGLLVASEAKAFLEGLKLALNTCPNPEFIVKLDADLKFASDYFMALFNEFNSNSRLGIAGGVIYEYKGPDLVREKTSSAHVRGATKVYRYECYEDIGGVRPVFGWDVIDEILACASGWHVTSCEQVHLVHLRRTASRGGRFRGCARNGYMAYYIGMTPLKMLLRFVFRMITDRDFVHSCGLAYGYFSNYFKRTERLPDMEIRRLVRQHQWVTARRTVSGRVNENMRTVAE